VYRFVEQTKIAATENAVRNLAAIMTGACAMVQWTAVAAFVVQ
jgi:hypothetical protein